MKTMKGYRKLPIGTKLRKGDKYEDGTRVYFTAGCRVNGRMEAIYRPIKRKAKRKAATGPTTAKERFENRLTDMLVSEIKRRKTGACIVLSHAVSIVNSARDSYNPNSGWRYALTPYGNPPKAHVF